MEKVILRDLLEQNDEQGFIDLHDMMVEDEPYWVVTTLEAGESYVSDYFTGTNSYSGYERAHSIVKGETWRHTMKKIHDLLGFGVKRNRVKDLFGMYGNYIEPDYYRKTDGVSVPYWFDNRLGFTRFSEEKKLYDTLNVRYMKALRETTNEDICWMYDTNKLTEKLNELVYFSGEFLYFRQLPECRPCTGGFIGLDLGIDRYGRDELDTMEDLERSAYVENR